MLCINFRIENILNVLISYAIEPKTTVADNNVELTIEYYSRSIYIF